MKKYEDSIDLSKRGWKSEAIKLMERNVHFVGVKYTKELRDDVVHYAQEHDYRIVDGPIKNSVGFVHRGSIKPRL